MSTNKNWWLRLSGSILLFKINFLKIPFYGIDWYATSFLLSYAQRSFSLTCLLLEQITEKNTDWLITYANTKSWRHAALQNCISGHNPDHQWFNFIMSRSLMIQFQNYIIKGQNSHQFMVNEEASLTINDIIFIALVVHIKPLINNQLYIKKKYCWKFAFLHVPLSIFLLSKGSTCIREII